MSKKEEEILLDKKKDNLMIYGMPESNIEEKKEEMIEDFRKLKKAYEEKVELKEDDLKHITRIGTKGNGKIRPIQITLSSQNKRKELLTNNMNLKLLENNISTNLYVSPDRTRDKEKNIKNCVLNYREGKTKETQTW